MDPGTILAVIQLSAAVLKLGRDISFEFFGPENAPEKLKHLNTRLQILNTFLEKILKQPGSPDKLSTTDFPGSRSILKTLIECKSFLEQYKTLLSNTKSLGTATQRVFLVVGPDASRIDEFHKKIDQHYTELEQWRIGSLTDMVGELRSLITSMQGSISGLPTTLPSLQGTTLGHPTPELNRYPELNNGEAHRPSLNHQSLSPTLYASPVLRPQSRPPSMNSIPELPSPATPHPPSTSSLDVPTPKHCVTLKIGKREGLTFSPDAYQVHEGETGRVVDWLSPQVQVRHFVPSDIRRIPYTKPNDNKMEVTFLPRDSTHRFEISRAQGSEMVTGIIRYQFTSKSDRETFQRRLRIRQYLEMVQVVKIHTSVEKDIAMNIHLKVWGRNAQDAEPTLSFAYLGKNGINHHVEYLIRWFRRSVELKGDIRLIMRTYSEDTDLGYGPSADEQSRRNSTLGVLRRRLSRDSATSFESRSGPIGGAPRVLYDLKGKTPPENVRRLGYLDIEFQSPKLRETFINACYEAHHPGTRQSRRGTLRSDTDTRSSSANSVFTPSPSIASPMTTSELEGVGLGLDMAASGDIELPSPAIPRTVAVHFNHTSPFALPDPSISELPTVSNAYELEARETSPMNTQRRRELE
ncbi:hypothetical protein F5Y19DRAFT_483399 [Xylariaceae sp. FL1651]|nr:hypothetical protein F5Y19DRAFT_483399 [Xylariaceae sp. FL1651]